MPLKEYKYYNINTKYHAMWNLLGLINLNFIIDLILNCNKTQVWNTELLSTEIYETSRQLCNKDANFTLLSIFD